MNKEEQWLLDEKYDGMETEAFRTDCAQLAAGEPLAYLIGHVPFLGCTIYLDSRPLIPRPETEYWCKKAISKLGSQTPPNQAHSRRCCPSQPLPSLDARALHSVGPDSHRAPLHILDLCAGSGCIGMAVLKHVAGAYVDFAEIDECHHATIRKNIEVNFEINFEDTQTPFRIFAGDLFENITDRYDYILTNPPYIDHMRNRTDAAVIAHEPHQALFGGIHGMEIITRIIKALPAHLTEDGICFLEHEPEQAEEIARLASRAGLTAAAHPDQYGTRRYSRIHRPRSHTYGTIEA